MVNFILYHQFRYFRNFFKRKFKSKKEVINFIDSKRIKIKNPKNFEEFVLSKLGKEIYENFYKNYTIKQWGIHLGNYQKMLLVDYLFGLIEIPIM